MHTFSGAHVFKIKVWQLWITATDDFTECQTLQVLPKKTQSAYLKSLRNLFKLGFCCVAVVFVLILQVLNITQLARGEWSRTHLVAARATVRAAA